MIKDNIKNYLTYNYDEKINAGLKYLYNTDLLNTPCGQYSVIEDEVYAIVQEYTTKDSGQLESHKDYIDIQYLIAGEEKIGYATLTNQTPATEYTPDIVFYKDKADFYITMKPGDFAIFYPQDLHMPCIKSDTQKYVKKVVVKVKI